MNGLRERALLFTIISNVYWNKKLFASKLNIPFKLLDNSVILLVRNYDIKRTHNLRQVHGSNRGRKISCLLKNK